MAILQTTIDRAFALMLQAGEEAGKIALDFFRSGERTRAAVSYKSGGSPVTEADFAVDRFLEKTLWTALPEAGWLSEEKRDDFDRLAHEAVFIVDPIDGTRGFVRGDSRWAVSIALAQAGRPVAAVVHAPALGQTFSAREGGGAALNGRPIAVSQRASLEGARIAGPGAMLERLARSGNSIAPQPKIPSLALRIAFVGSGALDAGLASTDAYDWDIAAADLVLREAGGVLCDAAGREPVYNAREPRHGVLAAAPRSLKPAMIAALRQLDSA